MLGAGVFVQWQSTPARAVDNSLGAPWNTGSVHSQSYTNADLPFATDHILVKLKTGEHLNVSIASVDVLDDALAAWNANPDVSYAETDHLYHTYAQEVPWGITEVKAEEARTTNSATGSGVKVAVVDTGVDYNHEDLDANNWVNSAETADDGIDNDGNGYVDDYYGYDFIGSLYTAVTPDKDPQDEYGHGTHVSGTIAAENNNVGVIGVAPSATIMPVKVLDAVGYGWDSTIADGIRYAADNGADIINMSLGGSFATHTVSDAVDYAQAAGVLVVAAAGNSGTYTGGAYPAQYSNVVSVGAEDEDGKKPYWSNWGKVDVTAPGVDVLSSTPGNIYAEYSGTSMASPHVAGVAALIAQKFSLTNNPRATRHILEVNTTDWGTITGPDYVSGQGLVDALAATGTQSAKGFIFADTGWITSDGEDVATLTVSLRSAANTALAAETVSWVATKGTLSSATTTTDANGESSVTLIADDLNGLAIVSATSSAVVNTPTIQIAINTDKVKPETVGVTPYAGGSDDEVSIASASGSLSANQYAAGDQIQIWTYATSADRETHDEVTMTYSVTDPDGNDVSELSGTSESKSVGIDFYGWFYINQQLITSQPLTIPDSATSGRYSVTVTTLDVETGESASRTGYFWVGTLPDLLLVYNSGYCADTPLQGWDSGGMTMCTRTGHVLYDDLRDLGYSVMLWDTTDIGYPTSDDMLNFPAVIWADAGLTSPDSYSLQTYMDAGGNLLLSSELAAAYEGGWSQPSDFLWNYLHARWISDQNTPDEVAGLAGGPFDGVTFNTDYYDLEGNGVHTTFYSDELGLNEEDDAEGILAYNVGDSTDKYAGVRVSTDLYRSVFLGFGIEAVNDSTGDATRGHMLDTLVSWLLGSGPSIVSVGNHTVLNNADRVITIHGHHFMGGGTTMVRLGGIELSGVTFVDRNTLQATIPAGFPAGQYKLKVINPDGQKDSLAKAVTVTVGGPVIESITPGYASNNVARTVVITGQNFKADSTVRLGGTLLTDITFDSATQLTVEIPKQTAVGKYNLKVTNPSGEADVVKQGIKVRFGFEDTLVSGDSSTQVKTLEKRLKTYGFFKGNPDFDFDTDTENALLRYQNSLEINESGILDYLTRYNLNRNE